MGHRATNTSSGVDAGKLSGHECGKGTGFLLGRERDIRQSRRGETRSWEDWQVRRKLSPGLVEAGELGAIKMAGREGGRGDEADVRRDNDEGDKTKKGGSQASFTRAENVGEGEKEGLVRRNWAMSDGRIVAHGAGYEDVALGSGS